MPFHFYTPLLSVRFDSRSRVLSVTSLSLIDGQFAERSGSAGVSGVVNGQFHLITFYTSHPSRCLLPPLTLSHPLSLFPLHTHTTCFLHFLLTLPLLLTFYLFFRAVAARTHAPKTLHCTLHTLIVCTLHCGECIWEQDEPVMVGSEVEENIALYTMSAKLVKMATSSFKTLSRFKHRVTGSRSFAIALLVLGHSMLRHLPQMDRGAIISVVISSGVIWIIYLRCARFHRGVLRS